MVALYAGAAGLIQEHAAEASGGPLTVEGGLMVCSSTVTERSTMCLPIEPLFVGAVRIGRMTGPKYRSVLRAGKNGGRRRHAAATRRSPHRVSGIHTAAATAHAATSAATGRTAAALP